MAFLEKIIKAKREEVKQMSLETVKPLRKTDSFYQQVKARPGKNASYWGSQTCVTV